MRTLLLLSALPVMAACGDKSGDDTSGSVLVETDADGDGYDAIEHGGNDCDDTDPLVNISGIETCNGVDDDCDGEIDEDASDATLVYLDADGDGYGVGSQSDRACGVPSGYAAEFGDCDDGVAAVNPGAEEACDGVDTDCDGDTPADESDADGDGFPGCEIASHGWLGDEAYTESDCDDTDADVFPGAEEVCDGADTDCDGVLLDEEADLDGDGFDVCRYDDCDDDDPDVSPGADEICDDGLDQDCDDLVDCADEECDDDPACAEDCSNGVDDDADGLVDCEDGECSEYADCIEVCDDDVDNDVDGLTDCEDFDDCAGTEVCPFTRQVHLSSGDLFVYGVDFRGNQYFGLYAYNLSGTVGTFDSAASVWKSCNWTVNSAYTWQYGSIPSTVSPNRWGTSVTGSCGMSRVSSFLPGVLSLNSTARPRHLELTYSTALGASSADWYAAPSTATYKGGSYSYWIAYGSMSAQTFWMED